MHEFKFETHHARGVILADNWQEARDVLHKLLDGTMCDGGWGWVENVDGERYELGDRHEIGCE